MDCLAAFDLAQRLFKKANDIAVWKRHSKLGVFEGLAACDGHFEDVRVFVKLSNFQISDSIRSLLYIGPKEFIVHTTSLSNTTIVGQMLQWMYQGQEKICNY